MKEIERCDARNELDEFINSLRKTNADLKAVSLQCDFKKIKFWHDGTTEDYRNKIKQITDYIEKVNLDKLIRLVWFYQIYF